MAIVFVVFVNLKMIKLEVPIENIICAFTIGKLDKLS